MAQAAISTKIGQRLPVPLDDLSLLLERQVDLVERQAVEHSENYIRRRNVLTSLETIYAA